MQDSIELKSFRVSGFEQQKQYSSVCDVPRALAMSQSYSKPLQRYFYKKQIVNNSRKNESLALRKHKNLNINSVYKSSNRSTKKSIITFGNEESKDTQILLDVPPTSLQKAEIASNIQPTITNKFQYLQNESEKINPKTTSDWTVVYRKNSRGSSKSKNRLQCEDVKIKPNKSEKLQIIRNQKEKDKYSNIDLVLKRHKASNVKQIQQRLRSTMSRGYRDVQKLLSMKEYCRKCGYNENSKIFIWNSEDQHIRRTLIRWGWVVNNSNQSPFFHLKWTYMPLFNNIKISQKQAINHFKNTFEITSKNLLTKNLRNNQSVNGKIDIYYPKCFDIGNNSQWYDFLQEYRHNILLILLKKVYKLCKQKSPQIVQKYYLMYKYHFKLSKKQEHQFMKAKNNSLLRSKTRDSSKVKWKISRREIKHLCYKFIQQFKKLKQLYIDDGYHYLQFDKKSFENIFPILQEYTLMKDQGQPATNNYNFMKQMYSTPSQLLIQRIVKEHQFLRYTDSIFQTYGEYNVWIVKPTSTSRGSGIFLTADLNEIQCSLKQIQSRLVQKYIQKPLLIKNQNFPQLFMRKFDLRQWVILKSIQPLQIYMFSECYLRLCYQKYNINEIQELNRHLTNYSINKYKFKNKNESVLPLSYLTKVLLQEYNVQWQSKIKPLIVQIIIKSIKSCIDNLQDYGGTCFQLFGYDILLDEQLNPWLLQVNMSPACQERTAWLTEYLNDMSTGLLKIVLPPQLLPDQIGQSKYKWERIYFQQTEFNRRRQIQPGLQIIGNNVKLLHQSKIDKIVLQNAMALKIQKFLKLYVPKYKIYKQNGKQCKQKLLIYLRTSIIVKKYQQKKHEFYRNNLECYAISMLKFIEFRQRLRKSKVLQIQKHLLSLICFREHQKRLQDNRAIKFLSIFMQTKLKKQLQLYIKQLLNIHDKTIKIQSKCREFLKVKKSKKIIFEKYFKSLLQYQKYTRKELLHEKNQMEKIVLLYIKGWRQSIKYKQALKVKKQHTICKYLKSLHVRSEFYTNKLNIFLYLMGRVIRVGKRRARCKYLKSMIINWQNQRKNHKIQTIYKYMKGLAISRIYGGLRRVEAKLKNSQQTKQKQPNYRKSGSIKHIRR